MLAETPQLSLWSGAFGDDYVARNEATPPNIQTLTRMWARMLSPLRPKPGTILEVGANIGLNLRAIRRLSDASITAVEPNAAARARLAADKVADVVVEGSASTLPFADDSFGLVFTAGVLIHIHPDHLAVGMREMHRVASRHILCVEYFSTHPREIVYRGNAGALFTCDFGKRWMEAEPGLRLVDHGFFWTGAGDLDDMNWWLFEKPHSPAASN